MIKVKLKLLKLTVSNNTGKKFHLSESTGQMLKELIQENLKTIFRCTYKYRKKVLLNVLSILSLSASKGSLFNVLHEIEVSV